MNNPTKTRRRFTVQQTQEAVDQRIGIPVSSLAKWVRQARIDRGDFGPAAPGEP